MTPLGWLGRKTSTQTNQPIRVMSRWSAYLTTLFSWAGLVLLVVNQYFCTFFSQKLTTALLESAERREWHFMINLHERMLPDSAGILSATPDHQLVVHQTDPSRPIKDILQLVFWRAYKNCRMSSKKCRPRSDDLGIYCLLRSVCLSEYFNLSSC